jgi:hypothetical protein
MKNSVFHNFRIEATYIFDLQVFRFFFHSRVFYYGHSLPQSWGPIRVLVSRARRLNSMSCQPLIFDWNFLLTKKYRLPLIY